MSDDATEALQPFPSKNGSSLLPQTVHDVGWKSAPNNTANWKGSVPKAGPPIVGGVAEMTVICCDKFEDESGRVFICELARGHAGAHEDGNVEWWNEERPAIKIHPQLLSGYRVRVFQQKEKCMRDLRITARIAEHIMFAPEREAAALRKWRWGLCGKTRERI